MLNRLLHVGRRDSYLPILQGWYENVGGQNRMLAMEGLRGLAILLVFLCHFQMVILAKLGVFQGEVAASVAEIGGTGVDLFFLLSGMLIYRAAMRPGLHYGRFLLRRIQRIYPTFLVVLTFYLVLSLVFHIGEHYQAVDLSHRLRYIGANLLLLPGIVDMPPVISAAWSLSYEFSFYLTLPILVRVFRMTDWGRAHRTFFWLAITIGYLIFAFMNPNHLLGPSHFQDRSFVRFSLFLSGMMLQEILQTQRGRQLLSHQFQYCLFGIAAVALASFAISELHTVHTASHHSVAHAVTRACLVLVLYSAISLMTLQPKGLLEQLFSYSPLRWVGNISYSFYLIHGFTLNVTATLFGHLSWSRHHPVASGVLLLFPTFLLTFSVATAVYLAVERPYSLSRKKESKYNLPAEQFATNNA